MSISRRIILMIILILAPLLFPGCSDDSPSEPVEEAGESSLLLGRTSVAMVVGASETVEIFAHDGHGDREPCAMECNDPEIATVAAGDSTLTITGTALGSCVVTVTSEGGCTRRLPVQIYDPMIIDTGELLITYTDEFEYVDNWAAGPGCQLWKPIPPDGFHAVGQYLGPFLGDPNGQQAMMVVKARPGSDAIVTTEDYEQALVYSFYWYRPVPPDGYKAMGMIANRLGLPDAPMACVREDLTMAGAATEEPIFTFFAYDEHWSWWGIEQPDAGPHASAYLSPGSYLYSGGQEPPITDPVMNILKVELPQLAEAPAQQFMPTLTGYLSPAPETVPRFARAMLVPCTTVRDAAYDDDIAWRVANSPFYRLERQVYYKLLYHNYNQTSEIQTNSVTIRSGVTVSESESFHADTGVSIAVETGVDIKFFSSKVTTTISLAMGYETQTSVTELEEKEVSTSINTAPGKAAALWQEFNRYVLYRHAGTQLEPVSVWEFGIDSYVTDEYPD